MFIYRTSFVINGERYFALFDDEMVSMRYAKNLAEGHGLVWNPGGERVEGYTNLFWVLYLAVIHLLPVDPSKISVLVQLTGALLLLANLVVVKRIAGELSGGSTFVSLAAVLLTAFYLPLNTWGLQGTEVSALTLLLSLAAYQSIQYLHSGRSSVWIYPLLGFGTLIRLDFVVPLLATLVFMLWADPWRKINHVKHALLTLLLFV